MAQSTDGTRTILVSDGTASTFPEHLFREEPYVRVYRGTVEDRPKLPQFVAAPKKHTAPRSIRETRRRAKRNRS